MMFSAKVKAIHSLGIDNLETYLPEEPDRFCISVRVIVGPTEDEGEESFDVNVCTPKWLADACERDGFVVGRHYLVVNAFNYAFLKQIITKLIERCSGNSWQEVAEKVGRIGYWEFEDYQS